ncbi:IS200/IS605 family transposase [Kitasatospora sp. NPDC004240]
MVFVTEYRHTVFADRHLTRLEVITRSVRASFEVEPVEFDGGNDHVHPLVNLPPQVAPSKPVNSLKRASSRRTRQDSPPRSSTTGGHSASGPARTSPAPSTAHPCRWSASTSSSTTIRPERRRWAPSTAREGAHR